MVLGTACRTLRGMIAGGVGIESVSVNVSVVQLRQADAVERLLGVIRGTGLSPRRITLEITESTFVSDYEQIAKKIGALSDAGIRFALDDFGTGYSNLSHVTDLPFDEVKIDKSLIWDSMTNPKCSLMLVDLTRMFRDVRLGVTAEGVETPEHEDFVRRCGCDKIQGFRYARPMPVTRAAGLFGRRGERPAPARGGPEQALPVVLK